MAESRTCPRCAGPLDRLDLHCPFCGAVFSRLKDSGSSRTAPAVAASAMVASVPAEAASPELGPVLAAPTAPAPPAPPQAFRPDPVPPASGYGLSVDVENPYQTPRSSLERSEAMRSDPWASPVLARRLRRLAAHFLDYMIVFVPPGILLGLSGSLNMEAATPEGMLSDQARIVFFGAMIPLLLVNLYLLGQSGQTMGKKLLGIRIVCTDGTPASLLRIVFLRAAAVNVLASIPILGPFIGLLDILFIFGDERRCIHDHFADTVVVMA